VARARNWKWFLGLCSIAAVGAMIWLFEGRPAYDRRTAERLWRDTIKSAPECVYRWENVRKLQTVPRPGSQPQEQQWYTSVYYELAYEAGQRERFIALYVGKDPKLETCEEKLSGRYGGAQLIDPQNPPVAMTIYEGDFVLQTTNDLKAAVPLEKLPLLFGPRKP
jgi:hypothetical protein